MPHSIYHSLRLFCVTLISILGFTVPLLHATVDRMQNPEQFWSFQKPVEKAPGETKTHWGNNKIDAYILARLEKNGLQPSPNATKAELIRRATFDLWGLPPSPEQIEAFVSDDSPDAYARLIDNLLDSPHYGEKWGQMWLDVIRFSESEGFEYDRHLPGAWRFRDYVIRSINEDKPFDLFITEQLAGDEMESPTTEDFIAAGFHRFGPVRRNAGNPEIALSRNEVLTERTDIIGSAFLGITIGCARCHDHKLDPFSQNDYYSLQAFLGSTQEYNKFLAPQEKIEEWQTQTDALAQEIADIKEKLESDISSEEKARLRKRYGELKNTHPESLPTILSIKNDPEQRTEIRVLQRGLWEAKGELVNLKFPDILAKDTAKVRPQEYPEPRTALAEWIVGPDNPLTARVLANRIWLNHFGNGIVNTPNDFGSHGESPSHPKLLDYLAIQLVENDWQLKALHRMIMLSATYQQSSRTPASELAHRTDPDNRLLWKFNRRRLQAEEIRDAILAISGKLNTEMFGESIMLPVDEEMVKLLYAPTQWEVTADKEQHNRRSVYLMAKRNLRLPFMETFDQPTLQASCGRRESSTHAPQALELLNGETTNQLAEAFAERISRETGDFADLKIKRAWMLVSGRFPTEKEIKLAKAFLNEQPLKEFTLALFNLNDFLYVH
jgi:hypothetical protein